MSYICGYLDKQTKELLCAPCASAVDLDVGRSNICPICGGTGGLSDGSETGGEECPECEGVGEDPVYVRVLDSDPVAQHDCDRCKVALYLANTVTRCSTCGSIYTLGGRPCQGTASNH